MDNSLARMHQNLADQPTVGQPSESVGQPTEDQTINQQSKITGITIVTFTYTYSICMYLHDIPFMHMADNTPTNNVTLKTPTRINVSNNVETNEVIPKTPAGEINLTLYWCTYVRTYFCKINNLQNGGHTYQHIRN